jgi:ABC-type transport system involved in multi-copper enzyme maturation permease subunit
MRCFLPSREHTRRLLAKELRELLSSRSYWLLLIVTGVLVGHAFIDSTSLYAEASGATGGPAALAQGLTPLGGIVVPVLGVYDLIATLLLPFVVIAVFARERDSGALAVMLQAPVTFISVIACKALALLIGWILAGIPALIALAWWRGIGGHLYAPEVMVVALGHVLRGVLTIGIGAAAAALAASASSAAIAALSITIGTWAVDYAAAAKGDVFRALAEFTPASALRVFEQGELRLRIIVVMVAVGVAGCAIAWQWMRTGLSARRRAIGVATTVLLLAIVSVASIAMRTSRDLSEDRRNSFSLADESALSSINAPLHVTAYLAPDDPRLVDLERGVFAKLRRVMPGLTITYAARGRSELFASPGEHYGEIWYELGGKRAMSRSATEEIVLETLYDLAGIKPPASNSSVSYSGYPLKTRPAHAGLVFWLFWPLLVIAAWWWMQRPPTTLAQP